jgi:hypothetical protein
MSNLKHTFDRKYNLVYYKFYFNYQNEHKCIALMYEMYSLVNPGHEIYDDIYSLTFRRENACTT